MLAASDVAASDRQSGSGMQQDRQQLFILLFSQAHPNFRWAEFESVCRLCDIKPVPEFSSDQSHLQLIHFAGGESCVQRILNRLVLLKAAYSLLLEAPSHEILLRQLKNNQPNLFQPFNTSTQSWSLQVRSIGRKRKQQYVDSLIQRYTPLLGLDEAPINLGNPRNKFTLLELYSHENIEDAEQRPNRVFLARLIGEGQTQLKVKYCLTKRCYIGNSTMDPELAFIQANLGLAHSGAFIMDPFCGTGGILLTAAHFGAHVLGVEIKWDVARARGKSSRAGELWLGREQSIRANFAQYGLDDGRFLGVILADSSQHQIWKIHKMGTLDAILTDPPYGIRERCQRLGKGEWRNKQETTMAERQGMASERNDEFRGYPEKQQYAISSAFLDLIDLASRLLKLGGRLAFWFPVCKSQYSERILPRSECMRLLYNCEHSLTKESARHLLVYEKVGHPRMLDNDADVMQRVAYFEEDCYRQQTFRQKMLANNNQH